MVLIIVPIDRSVLVDCSFGLCLCVWVCLLDCVCPCVGSFHFISFDGWHEIHQKPKSPSFFSFFVIRGDENAV